MVTYAVIFINLALVFYTIGVWSEKRQGELKKWHLGVFLLGLVCDTAGTTFMSIISESKSLLNLHGITGLLAIVLMLIHALWAAVVLIKNNENMKANFHKFSVVVWIIWLIPFLSGAIFHML
ncbi:HsmA family protein [Clostridium sp. ZS2-4]|uniref:HsmA family protein n=1 Tax=Clostridium sp. ZS2-4 TaxID=2987703 RepID=UPI00227B41A7|nr:HsmA family protein [Clostridium sp. ZS2-4]MCY6356449.1 HsmA family protein [Clostridium sp. ZS2-4]